MKLVSLKQIGSDLSFSWADNDVVNTLKSVDVIKPDEPSDKYMITVTNPSTVTSLTVKIYAKAINLGGSDKDALITQLSFPANDTQCKFVHGVFAGTDIKIVISNDTALGVGNAFSATLRIREVN